MTEHSSTRKNNTDDIKYIIVMNMS